MSDMRFLKKVKYYCIALLARIVYHNNLHTIRIIFVTGTNGKTTTSHMLYTIINGAKQKASVLTTVGMAFSDGTESSTGLHTTTPSPFGIQKFLRQSIARKEAYAIIEVSSHAIDQLRIYGLTPYISIYTNISPEHLDYHKTFENYQETKAKLIPKTEQYVILNHDDACFSFLEGQCNTHHKAYLTYGIDISSTIQATNLTADTSSIQFTAQWEKMKFPVTIPMLGEFNASNALAALLTGIVLKLNGPLMVKALENYHPPKGRMEVIQKEPFLVLVDFAHTAQGLSQALKAAKHMSKKRLIVMFGAESERYSEKRPLLGKAATQFADIIILTSDDPRFEDSLEIMHQIEEGVDKNTFQKDKNLYEIPDRKEAITFAIKTLAQPGDTILFSGKGHEKSIAIQGKEIPWDEVAIVQQTLSSV